MKSFCYASYENVLSSTQLAFTHIPTLNYLLHEPKWMLKVTPLAGPGAATQDMGLHAQPARVLCCSQWIGLSLPLSGPLCVMGRSQDRWYQLCTDLACHAGTSLSLSVAAVDS